VVGRVAAIGGFDDRGEDTLNTCGRVETAGGGGGGGDEGWALGIDELETTGREF